jgi:hypothetical protein
VVPPGPVQEQAKNCSEATLHGTYLFALDAVDISIRGEDQVPFAEAGYEVYDGNGKVKGVASGNFNGEVFRNVSFSGTYTVKADCTATVTYPGDPGEPDSTYDLFIAPDGSMFTFVRINPPERVMSGSELRGTARRVGD